MRLSHVALIVALLGAGRAPQVRAQVVRGQVKDGTTNQPAHGIVTLVDSAGALIGRTPTGPQGQYALPAPGPGAYLLHFLGPGYGPSFTPQFTLAAGETRVMEVEVVPLPAVALDTIIVEGRPVPRHLAGFYQRKSGGPGEFLTREDIERWNPSQPTDVFRRVQGVRVVSTDLGYRLVGARASNCSPAVFLDGVYMGTGAEFDFDGVLTAEQIEGVEVYGGAGQIPVEFNRSDCGAVVVWTRVGEPGVVSQSHFDLGVEAGGWVSSEGFQQGRAGAHGLIGLGAFEVAPAVHFLVPSFRTGNALEQSGVEVQFTLRGRPFGAGTPWYGGAGVTLLELDAAGPGSREQQSFPEYFLLLAGASLPRGVLRPFVEVQALNPFAPGDVRFQVFAGALIRVY